jgi:hypothetical protein
MTSIALIHPTAPPHTGAVENLMYHHLRLLNAAGYPLRVIAGHRDEAYYEASFYHQVDFFTVDLSAAAPQIEAELAAALNGTDVWLVYELLTQPPTSALTSALSAQYLAQRPRLLAFSVTPPTGEDASGLTTQPWPGVVYAAANAEVVADVQQHLGLATEAVHLVPSGVDEVEFWRLDPSGRALNARLNPSQPGPVLLLPNAPTPTEFQHALQVLLALDEIVPGARLLVGGLTAADPATAPLAALRRDFTLASRVAFTWETTPADDPPADEATSVSPAELHALADLLFVPLPGTNAASALQTAALARLPAAYPAATATPFVLGEAYAPDATPTEIAAHIAKYVASDPAIRARRAVLTRYTWAAVLSGTLIPLVEGR